MKLSIKYIVNWGYGNFGYFDGFHDLKEAVKYQRRTNSQDAWTRMYEVIGTDGDQYVVVNVIGNEPRHIPMEYVT